MFSCSFCVRGFQSMVTPRCFGLGVRLARENAIPMKIFSSKMQNFLAYGSTFYEKKSKSRLEKEIAYCKNQ